MEKIMFHKKRLLINFLAILTLLVLPFLSSCTSCSNDDPVAPADGDADDTDNVTTEQVVTPAFSPAGGTYASAQSVSITSTTAGALIYYTIDGSDPTSDSSIVIGPIDVTATSTLKAIAMKSGMTASGVATAAYTISGGSAGTVETPAPSVTAGTYNSAQSVTLATFTAGASIYYTTNGNPPSASSALYSSAISISQNTTLKAIAIKSGMTDSAVMSVAYVFQPATPTFTPGDGVYASAQSVTISCSTPGTSLYYTLDGNPPTTSSTLYTGAVSVTSTKTLKAIAAKTGWNSSSAASAIYTITGGATYPAVSNATTGATYTTFADAWTAAAATTQVLVVYTNKILVSAKLTGGKGVTIKAGLGRPVFYSATKTDGCFGNSYGDSMKVYGVTFSNFYQAIKIQYAPTTGGGGPWIFSNCIFVNNTQAFELAGVITVTHCLFTQGNRGFGVFDGRCSASTIVKNCNFDDNIGTAVLDLALSSWNASLGPIFQNNYWQAGISTVNVAGTGAVDFVAAQVNEAGMVAGAPAIP
jgi:hypothetical protein